MFFFYLMNYVLNSDLSDSGKYGEEREMKKEAGGEMSRSKSAKAL